MYGLERNPETDTEGRLSLVLQKKRIEAALPFLYDGSVLDFGNGNGQLAFYIPPSRYTGYDSNPQAVSIARRRFPSHRFLSADEFNGDPAYYDRIAALAVAEHIHDTADWLTTMRDRLNPGGLLVMTTPHPHFRRAHELGAKVGLFSKSAAEEHDVFLSKNTLSKIGLDTGFSVASEKNFLGGANQLVVLRKKR